VIGIDTNILVRYLGQDDPVQSRKATQIFEQRLTEDDPGFISLVTMAETAWVLERAYGLSHTEIAAAIERILQADSLSVQNEQEVFTAMTVVKAGRASFADALIAAIGTWADCELTLTFDKKAARLDQFQLV
jgi:predicted nucleic-acid-binding protein